jgi:cephalosporin hydroxylase
MVEAAAALGMASAWGLDGAKGALEELIWLSSDQTQPFPLFPCNYDGTIEVPLLEGGPKDKAVFAVPFYTQPDWSSARRVVAEHVGNGCEGHPLFDQCVSAAVLAVRQLISGHCGNLANLESVVAAHASNPSDINQHIRTLETLATETSSVLELGVRGCSSSWAFLSGILKSSASTPRLILNDIDDCFAIQFYSIVKHFNVAVEYYWQDDLTLELEQPVDLVFIDTYHIYGQLKRELKKFGPLAAKYIVMHDTTVDADVGEAIRLGDNVTAVLSSRPGWVEEDVVNGLWRAVTEFLDENADTWELVHRYTNNNGLTVLRRKHQEIEVTSSQVAAPPEEENSRRQWKGFY